MGNYTSRSVHSKNDKRNALNTIIPCVPLILKLRHPYIDQTGKKSYLEKMISRFE